MHIENFCIFLPSNLLSKFGMNLNHLECTIFHLSKLTSGSFNLLIKDDNVYTATSMKIKLKCI